MATAKSKRPERGRDGVDLSEPLRRRLEVERRRLQKASAVLASLVFSVNRDADDVDAGDVAVSRSI